MDRIREGAARVVRIVFLALALVLAAGAFVVAMGDNLGQDNQLVRLLLDTADAVAGPFGRDNGLFVFDGENAATQGAVVNWGLAAIVYLLIGRLLQRLLAPRDRSSPRAL